MHQQIFFVQCVCMFSSLFLKEVDAKIIILKPEKSWQAQVDTRNSPSDNLIIPDNPAIVGKLYNNNKMFKFNRSESTGLEAENKTKT